MSLMGIRTRGQLIQKKNVGPLTIPEKTFLTSKKIINCEELLIRLEVNKDIQYFSSDPKSVKLETRRTINPASFEPQAIYFFSPSRRAEHKGEGSRLSYLA